MAVNNFVVWRLQNFEQYKYNIGRESKNFGPMIREINFSKGKTLTIQKGQSPYTSDFSNHHPFSCLQVFNKEVDKRQE